MTDSTRIKGANWIPQQPVRQDQPENPLQTAYRLQREAHRQAIADLSPDLQPIGEDA